MAWSHLGEEGLTRERRPKSPRRSVRHLVVQTKATRWSGSRFRRRGTGIQPPPLRHRCTGPDSVKLKTVSKFMKHVYGEDDSDL